MLAKLGQPLGLDSFLLMSRGEAKDTGRARQYLVANAMEAVIASSHRSRHSHGVRKTAEDQTLTGHAKRAAIVSFRRSRHPRAVRLQNGHARKTVIVDPH